jgi:hypothetical protein
MRRYQRSTRCLAALLIVVGAAQFAQAGWRVRRVRQTQVRYVPVQAVQQPTTVKAEKQPVKKQAEPAKTQVPTQAQIPVTAQVPVGIQVAPRQQGSSGTTLVSTRPNTTPVRYGRAVVTFDNQSGEPALVRLVGPTRAEVHVGNNRRNSIHRVAGGLYTIRVRYGEPGNYRYTEGQSFRLVSSSSAHSVVVITLHPVVDGNYSTHPISAGEFASAAP